MCFFRTISVGNGECRPATWARRIALLLCALALAALQGCATNRSGASVSPDADLSRLKKIYVARFAPDERGINQVIAGELMKLGFAASTGPDGSAPTDADAVVTYQDHWRWDITMYMIELKIFVRDPRSNDLLATGNSYHTSLTRKTPEEMAAEVLSNIFKGVKETP